MQQFAHDASVASENNSRLSQPAALVSETVKEAKQILIERRVKEFTGADVVAVARMIFEQEDKLRAPRSS